MIIKTNRSFSVTLFVSSPLKAQNRFYSSYFFQQNLHIYVNKWLDSLKSLESSNKCCIKNELNKTYIRLTPKSTLGSDAFSFANATA